jgi:hypothetical protein
MTFGREGEKVRLVPLDKGRHSANAQAWAKDPDRIPRRYWKRGAYRDAVILVAEREAPT